MFEMVGTADISENDLISGLISVSNNSDVKPLRLIEFLRDRAGLLISPRINVYTFTHRTFQEYLAACFLTRKDYPSYIAKLAKESPDRWREVALLAGAKSASGGSFAVWALADELCYKSPNGTDDSPQDTWGGYIAGQLLAESASLENVSERNSQILQRIQSWLLKIMSGDTLRAIDRVNAGNILDKLGDNRFNKDYFYLHDDPLLGFVEIPGGKFIMGSDQKKDNYALSDETPQHTLELETFYISKYPVTVSQYKEYLYATAQSEQEKWHQYNRFGNHPVVYIDWFNAVDYCNWLTNQLMESQDTPYQIKELFETEGFYLTLPSEAEWEKAARGQDGRIYPWGDIFVHDRLNYEDTKIARTSPVGCFDQGNSPYQIKEMSGNVCEWTRSIYGKNGMNTDCLYPYNFSDGRENMLDKTLARVIRGGYWGYSAKGCRVACRYGSAPDRSVGGIGFRLCLSQRSAG